MKNTILCNPSQYKVLDYGRTYELGVDCVISNASLDMSSSLNQGVYFQIQNDQCLEMDQSSDQKWIKLSNNGDWASHTVSGRSWPLEGSLCHPHDDDISLLISAVG